MSDSLSTIKDFIRFAFSRMNQAEVFFGHGTDNAWDESVALVLQSLHLPWDFDVSMWDAKLTPDECHLVSNTLCKRVDSRIPLAYLTQQAWFCGLPFYVDERVLVPRSPISELIANGFLPWLSREPDAVMDLCTGSGCIGIACANAFEASQVSLIDLSADALAVAAINIERHGLAERVSAFESNVFDDLDDTHLGRYDLIVSNPPYVDQRDIDTMPQEYHCEPMIGLASGKDGLEVTRRILREAEKYLTEDGILVVEVGNSWENLEAAYPNVAFVWLEFEFGGHGVFAMTAEQLKNTAW